MSRSRRKIYIMIGNDDGGLKSIENNLEYEFSTSEKQEARTFLRERFLRVITGVIGEKFASP